MTSKVPRISGSSALRKFLDGEAASAILLLGAAALGLVLANSPMRTFYQGLMHMPLGPVLAPHFGAMTPHLLINDFLMAVFFLLVGLEIKRELVDGRLASRERRRLPVIAAASGMAIPATLYLLVTSGDPGLRNGWGIPAATDIAFALGVLALLGRRAPTSLKLFLTTVAIADDIGAVAIIAVAFTASLDLLALGSAAVILLAMHKLGRTGVTALWVYLLAAACLWYAVLLSGVHATIAGILAALVIPIVKTPGKPDSPLSPLHRLEQAINPLVAYIIVPLFGFANAGLSLDGIGMDEILAPLPLGIALGLLLGKQLGIFGAVWLLVRFGLATKLPGATWLQIYGVSILCGVGFTMSLFISAVAFPLDSARIDEAKIGILLGSFLSAIAGYAVLRLAPRPLFDPPEGKRPDEEIPPEGDEVGLETPTQRQTPLGWLKASRSVPAPI